MHLCVFQTSIRKGEEITVRYLPALMGSARRRMRLRNNWGFDCACARCADATELGSMAGATLCAECHRGAGGGASAKDQNGGEVRRVEKKSLMEYIKRSMAEKAIKDIEGTALIYRPFIKK